MRARIPHRFGGGPSADQVYRTRPSDRRRGATDDCFDAGFVAGLLEGLPLDEVGRLANACGALGATRKGPMEGAFAREMVEEFMQGK